MKPHVKLVTAIVLGLACFLPKPSTSATQGKVYPLLSKEELKHQEWLRDRIEEAHSIKVGMTRADLLKVFEPDGGLQRIPPEIYVLRNCSLIKVRAQFEFPKGMSREDFPHGIDLFEEASGKSFPINTKLKISEISKPYLESMHMD